MIAQRLFVKANHIRIRTKIGCHRRSKRIDSMSDASNASTKCPQ